MSFSNNMTTAIGHIDAMPEEMRLEARNAAFGHTVPFTNTAGLSFDVVTQEEVVISIANVKKVQNHIKGVHAAAMALLAETATGFVVGMNVPDDKIPLLKSMHVNYRKVAQGDLKAVATLAAEQVDAIRNEPKGSVTVACQVTDESGNEPIECEMVWAWIPKKKKEK